MNTINPRSLIFFLFFLFACHANGNNAFIWKPNGHISDASGHDIRLQMQNIYAGKEHANDLYVIGYKIDSSGINYPTAARIGADLKEIAYWSFETDLQDIFVYKDTIYINDTQGSVFFLKNNQWESGTIKLKPTSMVISSTDDLVACYPSSAFKETVVIGECYAVKKGWQITVNWRELRPAICRGFLSVFERNHNETVMKKISTNDGKVLAIKPVRYIPGHSCDVVF